MENWDQAFEVWSVKHNRAKLVWKHLSSRVKFVLKASNWSRSIKKTSNNNKNLVGSFVIRTDTFQGRGGGGVKISLTDYA